MTASSDVVYCMSPDWKEMRQLDGRDFIPDTKEPSRNWLGEYIHPDDQPHATAVIDEAIRTKGIFELEHRVVRVDGTLGWTFSRAIPLLDENGTIVEWFGVASDIAERKEAEDALRLSEEKFAKAFATNPAAVVMTRLKDGVYLDVNETFLKMFGYSRDEIIGPRRRRGHLQQAAH
ncbi:MAG: PAS domain-containing protein [Syntrophorhabdales bacterium]|jgi:PAS domain-containing protein